MDIRKAKLHELSLEVKSLRNQITEEHDPERVARLLCDLHDISNLIQGRIMECEE